jgi:chitodextrinase
VALAAACGWAGASAPHAAAASRSQTVTGTLQVAHSDDFKRGKPRFFYYLKAPKRPRLTLSFGRKAVPAKGGATLQVTGRRSGKRLVVKRARVKRRARSAATTNPPRTRRVAVVLLNFSTNQSQPFTAETARSVMFTAPNSIAAYYKEQSYGRLTLTGKLRSDGDVFGWYTIPYDGSGCQWQSWGAAARSAAQSGGVDMSGYDNIVYVWPRTSSCGWAGLGYMPGSASYVNGDFNLRVAGHELGHNFGAHHAATYSCTSGGVRVSISSTCGYTEYGDPFDIMGSASTRHANNFHIAQFGWLSSANTQTVTASGTYTLNAIAPESAAAQVIRIPSGDPGEYYYLEYRRPFGTYFDNFSLTDPVVSGVSIRLGPGYEVLDTPILLDATPTTSSFLDAALSVGRTFTDPAHGISITTASAGAQAATVTVSLGGTGGGGPAPDTTPPSAPGNVSAQATGTQSVSVAWSASTDNTGVAGYRVYRNGTQVTTTAATTFGDTGLTAATTYSYHVAAYDAAGNVSAASATVSAKTASPPPPTSGSGSPTGGFILNGTLVSGTGALSNVATDDDRYLAINAAYQSSAVTYASDWYGKIPGVPTTARSITVSYKGKASASCAQKLRVWNYRTKFWDVVDSRSVGTTETLVTYSPTAPADYITPGSASGEVQIRVRCTKAVAFSTSADLMRVTWS